MRFAIVFTTFVAFTPSQSGTPTVLEKMSTAYEELETLEADIVQTSSYPQLGLTDPPEKGVLQVEKKEDGLDVRLEFVEPERRVLVIEGGAYTFYQPRIRQAIVGRAGDGQGTRGGGFLKYLLGDVSGAEEEFEVEVLDEAAVVEGRDVTHLRLVPREGTESYYRSIELWVDEELGLPIQEKLVEPNQDEVLVRLDDIRVNEGASDFDFELDLPPDVERVKG